MKPELKAPQQTITLKHGGIWYQVLGSLSFAIYGFSFLYGVLFLRSGFSSQEIIGFVIGSVVAFILCIGGIIFKSSQITVSSDNLIFHNLIRKKVVKWRDIDAYAWGSERLILSSRNRIFIDLNLHCHPFNSWWPKSTKDELVTYTIARLEEVGAEQYSAQYLKRRAKQQ